MRRIAFLCASLALVASVGLLTGQQPGRQGPPGGFGGGFGGGGADPLSLIRNPQIQKELDISPEQVEKIPEAVQKAIKEVLSDKQAARLRQITLQQRGVDAFRDAKVAKDLKLTSEQQENIESIFKESRAEMGKLFGGGGGGFNKDAFEKMRNARKEMSEKVMDVLTADQRKQYKQMLGEEFKLEQRSGFPGFGRKKDENK